MGNFCDEFHGLALELVTLAVLVSVEDSDVVVDVEGDGDLVCHGFKCL